MKIEWLDIVKLTAPLVTAILMVWLKTWIEAVMFRTSKQKTLSRLIGDEVTELPQAAEALQRIAESASHDKLRFVSLDVSKVVATLATELSNLDAKNAYCYAEFASCAEIVNRGLTRLSSFVESRVCASDDKVAMQLNRAIVAQARSTACDLASLGDSSLKVLNAIPARNRYQDAQAINALASAIVSVRSSVGAWPVVPPAPAKTQPGAITSGEAARLV